MTDAARKPGRPRDPDKLAKRAMVNFHPSEFPKVQAKADAQGKSISTFCREIIMLNVSPSPQEERLK